MISAPVIVTARSHAQPITFAAPSPLTCANFSSISTTSLLLPRALSCSMRYVAAAVKVGSSILLQRSGVSPAAAARHRRGDACGELRTDHERREYGYGYRAAADIAAARWVLMGFLTPDTSLRVAPSPLSLHPSLFPQACTEPAFVESWSRYILLRHVRRASARSASRLVNEAIRYEDIKVAETLFLHANITSEMNFTRDLLALHLKSSFLRYAYPQPSPPPPSTSTSPTPCWRSTQRSCLPLSTFSSPPHPPTCFLPSLLSPFSSTTVAPTFTITHRTFSILATRQTPRKTALGLSRFLRFHDQVLGGGGTHEPAYDDSSRWQVLHHRLINRPLSRRAVAE